MTLIEFGSWYDARTKRIEPSGSMVLRPDRVEWFIKRLRGAGCDRISTCELTTEEYAARVRDTMTAAGVK